MTEAVCPKAELVGLLASTSAFALWLWHMWSPPLAQIGSVSADLEPTELSQQLQAPAGCLDYNASCLRRCPICERLSGTGCVRCHDAHNCHQIQRRSFSAEHRRRHPVRWLHFPKCGATLAVSVLSYACANDVPSWHTVGMALRGGRIDVRMAHAVGARGRSRGTRCGGRLLLPFDGHQPVTPRDARLITMFRRPSQRLISAYLDNLHAWGLSRAARAQLKTRAPTIAAFVRHPGIAGCMAKMLAGHHCAADVDLSDGEVVRTALGVLRSGRFAFIGLAEQWTASICLLHRMLPAAPPPMLAEFRQLGHSVNSHRDPGPFPLLLIPPEFFRYLLSPSDTF